MCKVLCCLWGGHKDGGRSSYLVSVMLHLQCLVHLRDPRHIFAEKTNEFMSKRRDEVQTGITWARMQSSCIIESQRNEVGVEDKARKVDWGTVVTVVFAFYYDHFSKK